MSSDKHCCVPGCTSSGGKNKVLHGFPNPDKDIERFNTWLNAIGGTIVDLEKYYIYKYRRVCHSHFEPKYFCRNDRISNIAVPTLNMPAPVKQSTVLLAARNPMTQMPNRTILRTYSAPVEKERVALSNRNPMLQSTDWPIPSTSSGVHTDQTLATMSSLIPEKNSAGKENIAPAERNTKPAIEVELLSLNSLTLTKGSETESLDVGTRSTPKPSSGQVIDTVMDVQHKQGKYPRKKMRRLHMQTEEKELLGKLTASRIKLSKCRNKIKKLKNEIKAAKNVSKHHVFMKALENSTTTAKILIQMELRENKKNLKGRRFTMEEKIISLSILKQSPKAYRNLRKFFTACCADATQINPEL